MVGVSLTVTRESLEGRSNLTVLLLSSLDHISLEHKYYRECFLRLVGPLLKDSLIPRGAYLEDPGYMLSHSVDIPARFPTSSKARRRQAWSRMTALR